MRESYHHIRDILLTSGLASVASGSGLRVKALICTLDVTMEGEGELMGLWVTDSDKTRFLLP